MTYAELNRAFKSYERRKRNEAQERASFDYILSALIGRNVARYFNSMEMPSIQEVYPNLFDNADAIQKKQEEIQEKKNELSALRFKQFANAFNKRFNSQEAN